MEKFMELFMKVSIWGILPVFLAVIVLLSTVMVKCMKKDVATPIEEFSDKKKCHKSEKLYSKVNYLSEAYFLGCITLAILPFLAIFNAKYDSYIYEMIKKIEVASSIVTGLTAIAITMAVVIIVFDKRYYIVFSIREVLQKYKFSECLLLVSFSCLIVSGTTMTLLNGKIDSDFDVWRFMALEIGVIYNIVGVAYTIGVIIYIMFIEQKSELSLLGQLYRRFWLHRVDTLHFKDKENWSREAVEINIEYLIERYVSICKRKHIAQIEDIEFVTTMDCYKKKWYGKARDKFVRMMLWLLVLSTLINIVVLIESCYSIIFFNIIITVMTIALTYLNIESIQLVIMRLYSDTWGYYIYKKNGKELFIPRVALRIDNIYDKYIMRMNSLNAFFCIWMNYVDKDQEHIQKMYEEVIAWFEDVKTKNIATCFPVFTIGYFLFDNDIKINNIKELYKEIVLPENKQYAFKRIMHSQIFYLTKNFNEEVFGYREKLDLYLKWIES